MSPRANASRINAGAGLPATCGSASVAALQRGHHGAVAGQQSAFGRQGAVDVGGHPQRAGPDRQRRLGEDGPAGGGRMPLHHRDRLVGEQPHRRQPRRGHLRGQRVGTDHQHLCPGGQLLREQCRGALGAGDHVVGGGGETELAKVLGHLLGGAGGIVGDEQLAGVGPVQRVDGALGRLMAAENGAVEVEQQAIMLLRKGCHVRQARRPDPRRR